jgi:hypothetical protein
MQACEHSRDRACLLEEVLLVNRQAHKFANVLQGMSNSTVVFVIHVHSIGEELLVGDVENEVSIIHTRDDEQIFGDAVTTGVNRFRGQLGKARIQGGQRGRLIRSEQGLQLSQETYTGKFKTLL